MSPYRPIVSTLGFVLAPDRRHLLMVHRNARGDDEQLGKYNGLGGKLLRNEDVAAGMVREIREEAGIEVQRMTLRGTVNWTNFGPSGRDWLGFIFLIEAFTGTPFPANEEGTLEWVPLEQLPELPMWEGDRHFLPLVFDGDPRPFHGFLPYDHDRPQGWSFTRF
ncbi:MAG: 8-oxo-dGTP diphosphatase [Lentisphaeria bacterium]|jgi:8-oxo-dGTP diphosphatase